MSSLSDQLISLLNANVDGYSDENIREHFRENYESLVPIINDMLRTNRLQLFMQGNTLVYKLIHESKAAKLEGLGYNNFLLIFIRKK